MYSSIPMGRWLQIMSWVVVVGVGLVASPVLAGEGDKAAARAHYETASRMFEVREYGEALKEFKAAYIAKPDPAFLFNIGQCYRKMNQNEQALDFFQQYLKKAAPDDPNRAQVEARVRNIKAGLTPDQDPFEQPGAKRSGAEVKPLPAPPPVWQPPPPVQPAPAPAPAWPAQPVGAQPLAPTQPPGFVPTEAPPAGLNLTAQPAATPQVEASPFYTTWWFWTGVGAVVAAGTVTAVVLASRGGGGTNVPATTLGSQPVLP
jgi:hypothetical protein